MYTFFCVVKLFLISLFTFCAFGYFADVSLFVSFKKMAARTITITLTHDLMNSVGLENPPFPGHADNVFALTIVIGNEVLIQFKEEGIRK